MKMIHLNTSHQSIEQARLQSIQRLDDALYITKTNDIVTYQDNSSLRDEINICSRIAIGRIDAILSQIIEFMHSAQLSSSIMQQIDSIYSIRSLTELDDVQNYAILSSLYGYYIYPQSLFIDSIHRSMKERFEENVYISILSKIYIYKLIFAAFDPILISALFSNQNINSLSPDMNPSNVHRILMNHVYNINLLNYKVNFLISYLKTDNREGQYLFYTDIPPFVSIQKILIFFTMMTHGNISSLCSIFHELPDICVDLPKYSFCFSFDYNAVNLFAIGIRNLFSQELRNHIIRNAIINERYRRQERTTKYTDTINLDILPVEIIDKIFNTDCVSQRMRLSLILLHSLLYSMRSNRDQLLIDESEEEEDQEYLQPVSFLTHYTHDKYITLTKLEKILYLYIQEIYQNIKTSNLSFITNLYFADR